MFKGYSHETRRVIPLPTPSKPSAAVDGPRSFVARLLLFFFPYFHVLFRSNVATNESSTVKGHFQLRNQWSSPTIVRSRSQPNLTTGNHVSRNVPVANILSRTLSKHQFEASSNRSFIARSSVTRTSVWWVRIRRSVFYAYSQVFSVSFLDYEATSIATESPTLRPVMLISQFVS